ncbi:flagellar basal-body MS-ring/collar protein FliF [Glaciihabitans sp. dw_435]|uniref:flagellar basal-body MS-ring/collar protein FliF n=1 Tax=Glaciihabitans sp. dw_435 TaxID=2720081 RepID=UPI001BD65D69|nr:flagellar basal-body MS-ring/collar protein FliF [Glaciihabitans sp. dw_435]
MPAPVRAFFGRFQTTLQGFSTAQRTVVIVGVAVLILGIVALSSWLTKPSYTPLFSGLSAADASTIVEQLRGDNVPYELANGGATVLVPEDKVYEERLTAAAAGLPSASTGGYALLDDMGVTTSEFQQSVAYKRALEGELAKTVMAMKGVKTASVRLAIPEETVFAAEKKDPTASVFIETQNGVSLTSDQVNAIVHLTSASIEGLTPTNVAVIDANGSVLSAVGVGTTGSSDSQATDYETRVKGTVQTMLDRIVGVGNSTVAVAATVSSESADVTTETFGTTKGVPALSESTTKESFTGSGAGAQGAGVLGPDNIAVPSATNGTGDYANTSSTKNNAVNKVTETRTIPAGAIARQDISVAINSTVAGGVDPTEIQQLAAAAAGIQTKRGDTVKVSMLPFTTASATDAKAALAATEQAQAADRTAGLIRTGIIALVILVPVILALVLFLRRSRQRREPVEDGEFVFDELLTVPTVSALAAPTVPMPVFDAADFTPPVPTDMDVRRNEIAKLAAQDPEKTADFLRGLMDDRPTA